MAKVLILGGTAWLGREIAARAVADGDEVTCLARGSAGSVTTGATLISADRSAPDAYRDVAGQEWDDVIEVSYDLPFVTEALAALAERARHWTLISSISVYADNSEPRADENAALLPAADLNDYGQAKVAAEAESLAAVGDRLLIARAGLIVGAGDPSDRFGYWVGRFALAQDGGVLVPSTAGRFVQVIEVGDLAAWVHSAGRRAITGRFNSTGNSSPFADVLTSAAAIAHFTGRMVPAPDDWLLEHHVRHWAGPRCLPLWLPTADVAMAQRDNTAFIQAGGVLSDLGDTLARTLADEHARGLDRERRAGLSRAEELELLTAI